MSSKSSSNRDEITTAKILTWARGLETFERMDFVYLLMHSLFPTELLYLHGIVDGLLKRDESIFASSVQQANDFVRLSHFYEGHDPHTVIANDGLRRQFIVDLSALHPLNFYCADIFFGVLLRAELGTWAFNKDNEKILRELILITTMVARHAAFRFDNRLYIWNTTRILTQKLRTLQVAEEELRKQQESTEDDQNFTDALTYESVEMQPTITASGAERLVNGYCDAVPPPINSHHPGNSVMMPPSPSSLAFPPLGPPVGPSVRLVGPAKFNDNRPRPVGGKMNETTATGNAGFRSSATPSQVIPAPKPDTPSSAAQKSYPVENHVQSPSEAHEISSTTAHKKGKRSSGPRRLGRSASDSNRPTAQPEDLSGTNSAMISRSNSQTDNKDSRDDGPRRKSPIPNVASLSSEFLTPLPAPNMSITGSFPHVYTCANVSRQHNPVTHVAHIPGPGTDNHVQQPVSQKVKSCYNCGLTGHWGDACQKKKPFDPEQAEKYCSVKRDAKLYPETGRPTLRPPSGPHH